MARLGDVCKLVSGNSLPETIVAEKGELPYVKVAELNLPENIPNITTSRQFISVTNISAKQIIPVGTVIFPKRGGAIGTNKKRLVSTPICMDLNLMGAIPSSKLYPQYLYYFFENIDMGALSNGSSVPQINNSDITPLEIRIPDITTQKDIATRLDKVTELIALRKEQLAKLDELVKSRFIEMFVERASNPEPLKSFLEDITYGFTNPMPDAEEGPWKVTAKDVVDGKVNYNTARKTTVQAFDELTAKSKPTVGDVLLTKDGTLGRCAVVEEDGICVNQSVAVLKCNEKILPKFLAILLQMPEYQREMLKNAGGGTIKHIYITKVVDMLIVVPSISRQMEFLSFVEETDKSKLVIQQSLDKLELLKKSLMQEYFG